MTAEPRLSDYRTHYRVDADLIQDPADMAPVRSASERRRLETIRRLLAMRPSERMLDLGCGSGWLSHLCSDTGARIVASDIAPAGVAAARARFPQAARYTTGDAYHLPLASSSFDAVVMSEVLEHLERPAAGIAEAARVLEPSGRLLITVPDRETVVEHLCVHCNRLTPANAHLHSFDASSMQQLLAAAGLRVAHVRRMTNKLLELAGFPERSRRWPYFLWRGTDGLFNAVVRKPAFLLTIARKG